MFTKYNHTHTLKHGHKHKMHVFPCTHTCLLKSMSSVEDGLAAAVSWDKAKSLKEVEVASGSNLASISLIKTSLTSSRDLCPKSPAESIQPDH